MIAACTSDNWPTAVEFIGVAWAIAAAYIGWRLTGGKHDGERRP